jgi:hypothetical protein
MIEPEGEVKRPLVEKSRGIKQRRSAMNRLRDFLGLMFGDLAEAGFLPGDVCHFRGK